MPQKKSRRTAKGTKGNQKSLEPRRGITEWGQRFVNALNAIGCCDFEVKRIERRLKDGYSPSEVYYNLHGDDVDSQLDWVVGHFFYDDLMKIYRSLPCPIENDFLGRPLDAASHNKDGNVGACECGWDNLKPAQQASLIREKVPFARLSKKLFKEAAKARKQYGF